MEELVRHSQMFEPSPEGIGKPLKTWRQES